MAYLQPFRALRYNTVHVGAICNVVAPPYDVINGEMQDVLYKRHPANVVRLILNRSEPGDDDQSNRYTRAARFLKNWVSEGLLYREAQPAIYVYHQEFQYQGQPVIRRGFMARLKLEPFGEGSVYPHEETHTAAKEDRLRLIETCQANLSQIFGLYPDPDNKVQRFLENTLKDQLPIEARDDLGVLHRLWCITDLATISHVSAGMENRSIYIADGHHRYETACTYRQTLAKNGQLTEDHPANYVLAMFVGMNDSGMLVLPTHRLFRGLPAISLERLTKCLSPAFDLESVGKGTESATLVWDRIQTANEQGYIGLYSRHDDCWLLARINDSGRKHMIKVAQSHGEEWRTLGVSILQRLIIDTLLDIQNLPKPMYVHSVDEVIDGLVHGDTQGRDATGQEGTGEHFELASLVMPANLDEIRVISENNERMPAKSTYFYPKLLSGLVIHPLW